MIKPIFENIKPFIFENISRASKSIWVASAFFTDKDIFSLLCILAKRGIDVKLLVSDHPTNLINSEINYQELNDSGGAFILANRTNHDSLMHHKFCIIDEVEVITGSYNWTVKAAINNIENIVLIRDKNVSDQFKAEFLKIEELFSNKEPVWLEERVPSGYLGIDRITKGFYPGELTILAGRSNMKHDILAQNIALTTSLELKVRVAYITTNQSSINLGKSLVSIQAKIALKKISSGRLEDYEWQELQEATETLRDIPLDIQEGDLSLNEIEKKCKIFKYRGAKLIIIDKIDYFLTHTGLNNSDENNRKIISRFKQISRLIRLPIILVTDMHSPKKENRFASFRPNQHDLGYIYDDCDSVILIHRDEEYGLLEDENGVSKKGIIDIIIKKHYLGFEGEGRLSFDHFLNKFSDIDVLDNDVKLTEVLMRNKINSSRLDEEDIPF